MRWSDLGLQFTFGFNMKSYYKRMDLLVLGRMATRPLIWHFNINKDFCTRIRHL
jgi:hypothetical protein